jgi:hypothetical protein
VNDGSWIDYQTQDDWWRVWIERGCGDFIILNAGDLVNVHEFDKDGWNHTTPVDQSVTIQGGRISVLQFGNVPVSVPTATPTPTGSPTPTPTLTSTPTPIPSFYCVIVENPTGSISPSGNKTLTIIPVGGTSYTYNWGSPLVCPDGQYVNPSCGYINPTNTQSVVFTAPNTYDTSCTARGRVTDVSGLSACCAATISTGSPPGATPTPTLTITPTSTPIPGCGEKRCSSDSDCPSNFPHCFDRLSDNTAAKVCIINKDWYDGCNSPQATATPTPTKPPVAGAVAPPIAPKAGAPTDLTFGLIQIGLIGIILRLALLFI